MRNISLFLLTICRNQSTDSYNDKKITANKQDVLKLSNRLDTAISQSSRNYRSTSMHATSHVLDPCLDLIMCHWWHQIVCSTSIPDGHGYSQSGSAYKQCCNAYSQSGSAYKQCCNAYSQSGSAYKQCCNAYSQSGSAHKQCCNAYSQSGSAHKQCENGLFAEHSQNFNLFQK